MSEWHPKRIQRKRTKGWRMPDGAVYVGRPTQWGNPFVASGDWILWTAVALGFKGDAAGRRAAAVYLFRSWIARTAIETMPRADDAPFDGAIGFADGREISTTEHIQGFAAVVSTGFQMPTLPERPSLNDLRGKDLACWCPLVDKDGNRVPCHADVLLELANAPPPSDPPQP